jgi:chemotaxis protein MotB
MVVRVLSELYGVPSDHLAAVGHADTRPLTENLDPEQRAKNRRVEVVILEQVPLAPALETGNNVDEFGRSTEDAPQSASPLVLEPSGERR